MHGKSHGAMAVFAMVTASMIRTPVYFLTMSAWLLLRHFAFFSVFHLLKSLGRLTGDAGIFREMPLLINYLLIAFFIFFGGTSATATFSGKGLWLTRMIPVTARDQIMGQPALRG